MTRVIFLLAWLLFPSLAHAETLSFSWAFDPLNEKHITEFRLMRDGNIPEITGIATNARSVNTARQTDKQSHVYAVVGFNAGTDEVSGSSAVVFDVYVAMKPPAAGALRMQVLPEEVLP